MPESKGYRPYQIHVETIDGVQIMTVGFGSRTSNDQNCANVRMRLEELQISGQLRVSELVKITGTGSMHTSSTITGFLVKNELCHAVAVYDKHIEGSAKFVVTWSHGPDYTSFKEGQRIE